MSTQWKKAKFSTKFNWADASLVVNLEIALQAMERAIRMRIAADAIYWFLKALCFQDSRPLVLRRVLVSTVEDGLNLCLTRTVYDAWRDPATHGDVLRWAKYVWILCHTDNWWKGTQFIDTWATAHVDNQTATPFRDYVFASLFPDRTSAWLAIEVEAREHSNLPALMYISMARDPRLSDLDDFAYLALYVLHRLGDVSPYLDAQPQFGPTEFSIVYNAARERIMVNQSDPVPKYVSAPMVGADFHSRLKLREWFNNGAEPSSALP